MTKKSNPATMIKLEKNFEKPIFTNLGTKGNEIKYKMKEIISGVATLGKVNKINNPRII